MGSPINDQFSFPCFPSEQELITWQGENVQYCLGANQNSPFHACSSTKTLSLLTSLASTGGQCSHCIHTTLPQEPCTFNPRLGIRRVRTVWAYRSRVSVGFAGFQSLRQDFRTVHVLILSGTRVETQQIWLKSWNQVEQCQLPCVGYWILVSKKYRTLSQSYKTCPSVTSSYQTGGQDLVPHDALAAGVSRGSHSCQGIRLSRGNWCWAGGKWASVCGISPMKGCPKNMCYTFCLHSIQWMSPSSTGQRTDRVGG